MAHGWVYSLDAITSDADTRLIYAALYCTLLSSKMKKRTKNCEEETFAQCLKLFQKRQKKSHFHAKTEPQIFFWDFSAKIKIGNFGKQIQNEPFLKDFQPLCISKIGTLVFRNQPKMHEELKKFAKNGNDESSVS